MKKFLILMLVSLMGLTMNAGNLKFKLITGYFSKTVVIEKFISIDHNGNKKFDEGEIRTPRSFKLVPEVKLAYLRESNGQSTVRVEMFGETLEYRNVYLIEVISDDPISINEEGGWYLISEKLITSEKDLEDYLIELRGSWSISFKAP